MPFFQAWISPSTCIVYETGLHVTILQSKQFTYGQCFEDRSYETKYRFPPGRQSSSSSAGERRDAERCDVTYGDVIDKSARKNVSICRRSEQDGELSRVYVSQSNLLHIVFTHDTSPHHHHQQHNFIIHVQGKQMAYLTNFFTDMQFSCVLDWRYNFVLHIVS